MSHKDGPGPLSQLWKLARKPRAAFALPVASYFTSSSHPAPGWLADEAVVPLPSEHITGSSL